MRASFAFATLLSDQNSLQRLSRLQIDLYGSLALTGIGHGTDNAVLIGICGEAPDRVTPERMSELLHRIREDHRMPVAGTQEIDFKIDRDLLFHRDQMYPTVGTTTHPNGLRFTAFAADGSTSATQVYYSIGGGFVVTADHFSADASAIPTSTRSMPYPFRSAEELLSLAEGHHLTIPELMMANETALLDVTSITRPTIDPAAPVSALTQQQREEKVRASILSLWETMRSCMDRGIATQGILPGGLSVRRRAARLAERLRKDGSRDPLAPLDWVTVYAMAVNEENAAGGRVVTAPTNGAAGVVPAVARYYLEFIDDRSEANPHAKDDGIIRYFLTAAAIGILYKENASISGAEVGCQGEVGVACSMAAGGLVAALSGTNAEIEHAAEIGMEHNLGMTCDPIGGLVQIPCIERNAMGAVKAVNASRMSMHEDAGHKVTLDQVIKTMYQTGLDMQSR